MELENPGSALGTMDHARRGVKRGHDVPALHLLQGRDVVRRRSANSSRLVRGRSFCAAGSRNRFTGATRGGRQGDQIWIDFQDRSLAEHNRTFNHVLELAHVSRPLVGTEMLHRLLICFPRLLEKRERKHMTSCGMSARRSRSGGIAIGNTFNRYNRAGRKRPVRTASWRSRFVAAITRTATRSGRLDPTGSNSCSCRTRRSFTRVSRGSSPISSRKIVPPSASSKRPTRRSRAPVKAPFTCPNNSLSTRPAEIALQFTFTSGRSRRALRLWIARAISSLPVPVSPRMSTLVLPGAT